MHKENKKHIADAQRLKEAHCRCTERKRCTLQMHREKKKHKCILRRHIKICQEELVDIKNDFFLNFIAHGCACNDCIGPVMACMNLVVAGDGVHFYANGMHAKFGVPQ